MDPMKTAEAALAALRLANLLTSQISLASADEITPEMRAKLHAERDDINAKLALVTPKK